jgi:hypothetical protein
MGGNEWAVQLLAGWHATNMTLPAVDRTFDGAPTVLVAIQVTPKY